jgi:hypothetical protein
MIVSLWLIAAIRRRQTRGAVGYGQLTCQGLNRANALPSVLRLRNGVAQYVFAPNPTVPIPDAAGSFYYVRPLATIEPTAVSLGLPVNVRYGYTDIAGVQSELLAGTYANSTVFIAWEHQYLQPLVQNIMNQYGGGVTVPVWASTDFDSLYVVRITDAGGVDTAQFTRDFEGLNGLSTSCQSLADHFFLPWREVQVVGCADR